MHGRKGRPARRNNRKTRVLSVSLHRNLPLPRPLVYGWWGDSSDGASFDAPRPLLGSMRGTGRSTHRRRGTRPDAWAGGRAYPGRPSGGRRAGRILWFAGTASGCSFLGCTSSLAGTACASYGAETCDGLHAVAVCDHSPDCSYEAPTCSTLAWRTLSCAEAHSCMTFAAPTLFDGAMCLPDTTDRTCVAGPALSTDPAFF